MYHQIEPLDLTLAQDPESVSVQSLRDAWVEQRASLAESGALSTFQEQLIRRWSIETGIIERLYTLDRGTTELLIERGLEVALIEHGASDLGADELVTILRDHRDAAQYVIDRVNAGDGLTLHLVRSLHQLLTRTQTSVEARTPAGQLVSLPLLRGAWKEQSNNPRRPDGTMHEYCPPVLVQEEMDRLVTGYSHLVTEGVPAVVAGAWLHHRFTQIHPFQDGNGRVARALTAYALVRADCFPIVVDRDIRDEYINALEAGDAGDLRPLILIFARLEKKELERALSLSEDVQHQASSGDHRSLRERLMQALRDKAREKRQTLSEQRRRVIDVGRLVFERQIVSEVQRLSTELGNLLAQELPGSHVSCERGRDETKHYFKTQVVSIAEREGYYANFEIVHDWVRLRVQRPGHQDGELSEVVVSMHGLGRHFLGVLVMAAYYADRFLDENRRSVTLDPKRLADRSLTFSYKEQEENVELRAKAWIGSVLDMGLAHLQRHM